MPNKHAEKTRDETTILLFVQFMTGCALQFIHVSPLGVAVVRVVIKVN